MYAVVTLQDSEEVMVAPTHWLSSDKKQCHWPPFKSPEKCTEAVQNRIKPETGGKPWEKLNISFHRDFVTFERAKDEQKTIEEQKERRYLLATGFSPILKRQRIESTQAKHQPAPASPASTSRMSAEDKDELLQMLRDIKSTVQENSAMLKKLLKDNTVPEVPSSSTYIPPKEVKTSLNLPLRTFEDMERSERELKTTKTRKEYVKYLSGLGGFGNRDVIKNIMQHVLTDDLAKEFNWIGKGNKKPFSQLTLADVIREAALKRQVTRVDCETEIKKHLSYTADRLGRKRARELAGLGLEIPNVIPTLMDDEPEISWDDYNI